MNSSKEKIKIALLSLLEMTVGILLMISPDGFARLIFAICGAVLMLAGLWCGIRYFRLEARKAAQSQLLGRGLTMLVLGGLFCFSYGWISRVFPPTNTLYGLALLLSALLKIQWSVDTLRLQKSCWILPVISTALAFVCALLLMNTPLDAFDSRCLIAGILLMASAVVDMSSLFLCKFKI